MSSRLLPCPGCDRHVRIAESLCPFCGEALPLAYQSAGPALLPAGRLGRAAKFAFGAAVAGVVVVSGCGDDTAPADSGTGSDSGVTDSGSGGDSSVTDSGSGDDAAVDSGGVMPAYGAPADAGIGSDAAADAAADAGPPDGSSMALYGAPPEG
ncbi:MAG: hypothetical protein JRH11_00640 [Deltaproteobacteria bacterium]|nr:hypothetical protein [Deltaproteobacteria bacterium]